MPLKTQSEPPLQTRRGANPQIPDTGIIDENSETVSNSFGDVQATAVSDANSGNITSEAISDIGSIDIRKNITPTNVDENVVIQ